MTATARGIALAVVTVLSMAGLGVRAGPAIGAPMSSCTTTSGVTVVVDFSHWGLGVFRGCASGSPSTGLKALHDAGFTSAGTQREGNAFICRINDLPAPKDDPCVNTPPASAYWAYYHAQAGDTAWTFGSLGAASYQPMPGTVDAWAFGAGAQPSVPPSAVLPPPPSTTTQPPTTQPPTTQPPTTDPPPTQPPTTATPMTQPPPGSPTTPGGPQSPPQSPRSPPGAGPGNATRPTSADNHAGLAISAPPGPPINSRAPPDPGGLPARAGNTTTSRSGGVIGAAPSSGRGRSSPNGVVIHDIASSPFRPGNSSSGSPLPALSAGLLVLGAGGLAVAARRRRNRHV